MIGNVARRLAERAAAHPERVALVAGRGTRRRALAYAELDARVAGVARHLAGRGLGPGSRVLIFVPMSVELYAVLLGTLRAGATAVFVDAWADRRRLDAAVRAARPDAFVGTPRAHLLRLLSPDVRAIARHVLVRRDFGRGMDAGAAGGSWPAAAPESPALVTFTTGTTGRPKGAVRSHAFLWAQHEALAPVLGLRETDVDMPTLPMFALHALASGCTCVLPEFDPRHPARIDAAAIRAQIADEGVTTLSASPAFLDRLLAGLGTGEAPAPLRALFTGGAPVLPELARRLAALRPAEAHVVYGSTEAEPIATVSARDMVGAFADPAAGLLAGRPVRGIDVRLVRAHDAAIALDARGWPAWDAAPGDAGEIVVTGGHVLEGYLGDPDAERDLKVRDGGRTWHRTGDAGRFDPQGRLWLLGRIRQRRERGGRIDWPLPTELRALGVPGIRHASRVVRRRTPGPERAVLFVETATGDLDPATRAGLEAALAGAPPDEIVALARIPRDPRHESKADLASLEAMIEARGH